MTSGCQAFVAMVQTAHLGEPDNLAILRTLHWSWFWGIFVQAQMGPTPVGVGKIGFEQAVQVSFIEHDDVEAIAEESLPILGWGPMEPWDHVFGDGALGNG